MSRFGKELMRRAVLAGLIVLGGCAALPPSEPIRVPAVRVAQWRETPPTTEGLSAQAFIDTYAVSAPDGRKLGEVENLILGSGGQISAVVVDTDTSIGSGEDLIVPWDSVRLLRDREILVVPVESTASPQGVADQARGMTEEPLLHATDVLDTFLPFTGVADQGYVEDFIFGGSGEILAVVANLDLDSMLYERYDAEPGGYLYGLQPDFILVDQGR